MKRVALVISCLFFFLRICSQQLTFFKPANLKKLPSSESYNILQDSRGYIWFSTEAGLCRYNGNILKVYGKDQGLPEEATYQLFEDMHNQLWALTSRNRIIRYNVANDAFEEASFSKKYSSSLKTSLDQVYFSQREGDSLMWLSSQLYTYKINLNTGSCVQEPGDTVDYSFVKRGDQLVHLKTPFLFSRTVQSALEKFITLSIRNGASTKYIKIKREDKRTPVFRLLTVKNKKGDNFIAYDNVLVKVRKDLSYESVRLNNTVLGIYMDNDDGLWLGASKSGVIYYPQSKIADSLKITALTDLSVTGICEDQEGGIWCSTLENGIFYCRNKQVLSFANIAGLNQKLDLLKTESGRLFASGEKNELVWLSGTKFFHAGFPKSINYGLTDILSYHEGWIISGKREVLQADHSFVTNKVMLDKHGLNPGFNQLSRSGNRIFGIQFGGLFEITNGKIEARRNPLKHPGGCLLYTQKKALYVGGKTGLTQIDTTDFSEHKVEGISGSVSKIAEDSNGVLWIATKNNGVYIHNQVQKLSTSLRLPTKRIFDIVFDRFGTCWLASNVGILRIKKNGGVYQLTLFNTQSGLPSEEVNALTVLNDVLYVSTHEGLSSLPVQSDLINHRPPSIYINSVSINDSLVNLQDGAELPYNDNNITVFADVLTYKQPFDQPRMFYLLSGLDKHIHFVDGREWTVNNLAPGYYTLFLYALNNNGVPSINPVKISFTILKPFWLTPLFLVGASLLIFSLLALSITIFLKRIQKKEKEKTRINTLIAQYHMSALRAQMNPHFIFNCINSIQRFVITNKSEEAYDYLSKFSKLIRLVLNYAEENFITLEQELELISLYLALEQMRVDSKFTWTIDCAENVRANALEVPVMMLQPYVENAIWHGVMNLGKEKRGNILIKVTMPDDQLLEVVIEDNGIGREKAAQLAARNHRSKATGINQKRAEMLNILNHNDHGRIEISDLVDAGNNPAGTRVKIFIAQKTETHEYSKGYTG